MATPYCPNCDSLTDNRQGRCSVCDSERPVEGWPEDPLIGRLFLDSYTVIRRLGSGGFGVVYLAENKEFGAKRAIKVLDSRFVHRDKVLRRFKREAKALYQLQSPYTVRVERWGRTEDGHYYLVMEFAEGETLRQILEREGRLDELRALSIARQTAVALADACALGILHRDLKPENLVVRHHPHEGDRVAVLDFGISKILSDESSSFKSGLVGTPSYMAPECWNPALGPQDIRADLWSLGVIFFETLAGRLPFEDETGPRDAMTTAFQVANLEPEHVLERLDPLSVHTQTRAIVSKLLRRRPTHRYASPDRLLEDIDRHPLWAARVRRVEGKRAKERAGGDLETAETVPDLRRPPARPDERPGTGPDSAPELGLSDDTGSFSFEDEPPEDLRISRTDPGQLEDEVRRGPSLGTVLIALVILGAIAVAVRFADRWLAFGSPDGQDAGPVAVADAATGEADTPVETTLPATRQGQDGMVVHLVPGGPFEMGLDEPATMTPAHAVILDAFYLDQHEVTVGMWLECVGTGRCLREHVLAAGERDGCRRLDRSPADAVLALNCVSWEGARAYCETYARRLPTEAEWERAARGIQSPLEPAEVEEETPTGEVASAPVDLAGGLSEWVADWYSADYYDASPTFNPTGSIFGTAKVVRGAPLTNGRDARLIERYSAPPEERHPNLGFRCAVSAR